MRAQNTPQKKNTKNKKEATAEILLPLTPHRIRREIEHEKQMRKS
jgi:hypothetical protein